MGTLEISVIILGISLILTTIQLIHLQRKVAFIEMNIETYIRKKIQEQLCNVSIQIIEEEEKEKK